MNLLIDKETPQVKVRSFLPIEGRVQILVKEGCELRFRIPERSGDLQVSKNGNKHAVRQEGEFAHAGELQPREVLDILFPLYRTTKDFQVGNEGFQQYAFEADWLGETVTAIRPDPANSKTGFSHVMKRKVPLFYGSDAPGLLYQAQEPLESNAPCPILDKGTVDWYSLKANGRP